MGLLSWLFGDDDVDKHDVYEKGKELKMQGLAERRAAESALFALTGHSRGAGTIPAGHEEAYDDAVRVLADAEAKLSMSRDVDNWLFEQIGK